MASLKENNHTPLKKRSVVSSFIIKYPEKSSEGGKPQVALFRRSDKVGTYRHHLAPISGSIENDDISPLAAAWRELHEETTLTPENLELIRQGKSYTFKDQSVGREWTVYPFVYQLKAPETAIQIDWEHEGWGWYDPMEVQDSAEFGGVPRLAESLRRAWFEKDLGTGPGTAGALLGAGLDRLKNDHQSGARELASVALGVLKDVVQSLELKEMPTPPPSFSLGPSSLPAPLALWWTQVRVAAWHIWKNGRESMGAAILSVLIDALKSIESTLLQHCEHPESVHSLKWRDAITEDLNRRISLRTTSSAVPVSDVLVKFLEDNISTSPRTKTGRSLSILTLSESSTIALFLRRLVSRSHFTSIDLRVLESRPLFEGVSLAASIASYIRSEDKPSTELDAHSTTTVKTNITIYTDASTALAVHGVDVVLLGADRIASSGAVSNKTGSLPAVLSVKQVPGAKVIVLGETEKIATPGDPYQHVVEDNDPTQLTRAWHSTLNSERVREAATLLDSVTAAPVGSTSPDGKHLVDVQVRNIVFEWVPPQLIDAYITEFGLWTVQDITRHSEIIAAEEERLFKEL